MRARVRLDFAELLLRAFELWRDNPELLRHYRARFPHVLVDEFQDTNSIQYAWIRLLVGTSGCPFVVGDDDQSIYRWRGAKVENLQKFRSDFPQAQLYKLEQNYRSSAAILEAANALIANNSARLGKELWTSGARGEPVRVYCAYNERDEADFVLGRIQQWIAGGGLRRECAILYRSNAQSRVFEEALIQARMPYRCTAACGSSSAPKIKDALAYLRLIANRDDDASFERVVNLPVRGIGARTLDGLARGREGRGQLAVARGGRAARRRRRRSGRGAAALHGFLALIERLGRDIEGMPLHEQVDHVINNSGLIEHFRKDKADRGEARIENLAELVSAARGYEPEGEDLPAAAELPRACRARIRRDPGERVGRLRADDDAAHGERSRVPSGLPGWHGRRPVSRTSARSTTSPASKRNGASVTSASLARCASCTSATPSSGACTASTATTWPRASSRKCRRACSRKCGRASSWHATAWPRRRQGVAPGSPQARGMFRNPAEIRDRRHAPWHPRAARQIRRGRGAQPRRPGTARPRPC